MKYLPIIGIEVHVELKTKSKMFCSCSSHHFRVKPNTHTCPVCLGLPGALPVPNKKAIDWCIQIGLALNCKINKFSKFDRKNYFYPDLPKGYQISQYDQPFCRNGKLQISTINHQPLIIKINRVHMEEDTAKLIHQFGNKKSPHFAGQAKVKNKYTLIDFNRSGVPLVEIVTEPDIHSALEAVLYLKKLQQIIRYLGFSDCDMEKGSMRCEINISLASQIKNAKLKNLPKYKVEIKNLNSFRFVKKAIDYEIKRQKKILLSGKIPIQETRGYNERTGKTYSQRIKEEAHDYRYFPEPDIPPIKLSNSQITKLLNLLPELPDAKIARFVKDYNLSEYNAKILAAKQETADYFDKIAKIINKNQLDKISKLIVNKKININKFSPKQLVRKLLKQKSAKLNDKKQLNKLVDKILKQNQKAIKDFKKGKKEVLGFLIGQIMKETKGAAEAIIVKKLLIEKLSNSS